MGTDILLLSSLEAGGGPLVQLIDDDKRSDPGDPIAPAVMQRQESPQDDKPAQANANWRIEPAGHAVPCR